MKRRINSLVLLQCNVSALFVVQQSWSFHFFILITSTKQTRRHITTNSCILHFYILFPGIQSRECRSSEMKTLKRFSTRAVVRTIRNLLLASSSILQFHRKFSFHFHLSLCFASISLLFVYAKRRILNLEKGKLLTSSSRNMRELWRKRKKLGSWEIRVRF